MEGRRNTQGCSPAAQGTSTPDHPGPLLQGIFVKTSGCSHKARARLVPRASMEGVLLSLMVLDLNDESSSTGEVRGSLLFLRYPPWYLLCSSLSLPFQQDLIKGREKEGAGGEGSRNSLCSSTTSLITAFLSGWERLKCPNTTPSH